MRPASAPVPHAHTLRLRGMINFEGFLCAFNTAAQASSNELLCHCFLAVVSSHPLSMNLTDAKSRVHYIRRTAAHATHDAAACPLLGGAAGGVLRVSDPLPSHLHGSALDHAKFCAAVRRVMLQLT
jgi:hypothetical protein